MEGKKTGFIIFVQNGKMPLTHWDYYKTAIHDNSVCFVRLRYLSFYGLAR